MATDAFSYERNGGGKMIPLAHHPEITGITPYADVYELIALVGETIDEWRDEDPKPLAVVQALHKHLVISGHRSDEENILSEMDDHYKIHFNINEVVYYFETWLTPQGVLDWKIEDNH